MSIILKVNSKTKSEAIQKAHQKVNTKKAKINQTIADYYGALPTTIEDGQTYQKKQPNEW